MPSSQQSATFTLSRDIDGTISGGPAEVSPGDVPLLFRSGIDVLGGTLWFDVRRPEAIPFVEVTSPAAARWWAESVLGTDAAATLAEWTPDEEEEPVDPDEDDLAADDFGLDDDFSDDPGLALLRAVVEVEEATASFELDLATVGDSLTALRRLALGHWLRRYWPVGARLGFGTLNPMVMDCELATIAWSLDDILLTRQYAGPLLSPHAARLVDLLDDEGVVGGESARILRAALEVARHTLLPSHPAYLAVCELVEERAATWGEDSADTTVLPFVPRPVPSERPATRVAGLAATDPPRTGDDRRTDEVDWQQVPGQLLDWGPDAVTRTLQGDASGWEVDVTVAAGVAPPDTRDPSLLRAVVFTRDETGRPVELGATELDWAVGGGALVGTVRLGSLPSPGGRAPDSGRPDPVNADALIVNVVDASVQLPWPAERAVLRAEQAAARELIEGRESATDQFVAERQAFEDVPE